jgi:hypothetical protein
MSDTKPVATDVPQGSILGPLRILICVSDLPVVIQNALACQFADDTHMALQYDPKDPASVAQAERELNDDLQRVATCCISNSLN